MNPILLIDVTSFCSFSDELHFNDYKEYLQYVYNNLMNTGKITETIELIRQQAKSKPFDYEFNTQEGKLHKILWNSQTM